MDGVKVVGDAGRELLLQRRREIARELKVLVGGVLLSGGRLCPLVVLLLRHLEVCQDSVGDCVRLRPGVYLPVAAVSHLLQPHPPEGIETLFNIRFRTWGRKDKQGDGIPIGETGGLSSQTAAEEGVKRAYTGVHSRPIM